MAQTSPYLRSARWNQDGSLRQYLHWCPGCKEVHQFIVGIVGKGPRWTFNGNVDKPTFSPSMRIFDNEETLCHYFLRDGMLQFLNDCIHELKGQTVPLPPLPEHMQGDGYGDGDSNH